METRRMNPEHMAPPAGYHVWEPPGKPVRIEIDLDVIDRMQLEVMRGFGLVPRRGAEVGGLLLGTSEYGERLRVRIEDFEPVPCEYRNGPSYSLSANDVANLEEALARWHPTPERRIYVVGYYRSHTRDGSVSLGSEDGDLIKKYFGDPSQVYLLVKPFAAKVSTGGFFFQENGELRGEATCLEFPFRRKELQATAVLVERPANEPPQGAAAPSLLRPRGGGRAFEEMGRGAAAEPPGVSPFAHIAATGSEVPPVRSPRRAGAAAAVTGPAPDLTSPQPFGPPPMPAIAEERPKGTQYWAPLSLVFLTLGVALGFAGALLINKSEKPVTADPYSLNLSVVRNGENLELAWDPQIPAIRRSLRGTLMITDGDRVTPRQLSPQELEVGRAVYHRLTNTVQFRLEVFTAENTSIAEKLDLHLGGVSAAPTVPEQSEPEAAPAKPVRKRRRR
jgi:hypothetical protein